MLQLKCVLCAVCVVYFDMIDDITDNNVRAKTNEHYVFHDFDLAFSTRFIRCYASNAYVPAKGASNMDASTELWHSTSEYIANVMVIVDFSMVHLETKYEIRYWQCWRLSDLGLGWSMTMWWHPNDRRKSIDCRNTIRFGSNCGHGQRWLSQ